MALKELDAHPELRDNPSLKDFNDLPTFVKSYIETKSMVGASIRPPGPDASPEARKEFRERMQKAVPSLIDLPEGDEAAEAAVFTRLGRPAKPEEYEFKVPEGVEVDLSGLRTAAMNAGMTKKQFAKLAEATVAGAQKSAADHKTDAAALKTEWGNAYEEKLARSSALAKRMGQPDNVVAAIATGRLPASALKLWDTFAAALPGEVGHNSGNSGHNAGVNGRLTPAEVEARLNEVMAHPAYFNKNHPQHAEYAQKVPELMSQLPPRPESATP